MSDSSDRRSPDNHPAERASDKSFWALIRRYVGVGEMIAAVAVVIACIGTFTASNAASDAGKAQTTATGSLTTANRAAFAALRLAQEIQEGRRAGNGITCGIASAISEAGRELVVSSSSAPTPPKLEKFLQQFGYPSAAQRRAGALVAGSQYVSNISEEIQRKIGPKGAHLVKRDGTLDCKAVAALAHVPK